MMLVREAVPSGCKGAARQKHSSREHDLEETAHARKQANAQLHDTIIKS
jgi:hypothetical protein